MTFINPTIFAPIIYTRLLFGFVVRIFVIVSFLQKVIFIFCPIPVRVRTVVKQIDLYIFRTGGGDNVT